MISEKAVKAFGSSFRRHNALGLSLLDFNKEENRFTCCDSWITLVLFGINCLHYIAYTIYSLVFLAQEYFGDQSASKIFYSILYALTYFWTFTNAWWIGQHQRQIKLIANEVLSYNLKISEKGKRCDCQIVLVEILIVY